MENAHSSPAAAVLQRFGVQESCGLSPEQVRRSRDKYGPNGESAPREVGVPVWGGRGR
uniref:Cation-transporting P-type ATPase N-terminal domain-containing protein n=1 Tax=Terrapene triunguis TaxID=2587831 RepID=A0A674IBM3_9SAUR